MKNTKELKRENPTLTGRGFQRFFRNSDFHYSLPTDVLPFTGWDYNAVKKICHDKSITRMYSIYISLVLNKSMEKLRRNRIKCYFILSDFLNVEVFLPADRRYDRITTSNLRDYYPLTVLLTRFKGPLNTTNPYAVMSTEAINWVRNYMPEVIHLLPNMIGLDDLIQKALKDTRNPELANLSGMSAVVEYLNLTQQFVMFLRASLLFPNTDEDLASLKGKKKIPSLKSLVASLGLYVRDFVRCENTVFPFKWTLNCRRPTMLRATREHWNGNFSLQMRVLKIQKNESKIAPLTLTDPTVKEKHLNFFEIFEHARIYTRTLSNALIRLGPAFFTLFNVKKK